jgi:DNA mismatch repair protein MutL
MNPADVYVLKEISEELMVLGFGLRFSDSNTLTITARPSEIGPADPLMMLEILLEEFKSTQSDPAADAREKIAAAMASASAIPYGKSLLKNEMEELFDTLFSCKSPNYSPGGKPVINILTLEEIDKRLR